MSDYKHSDLIKNDKERKDPEPLISNSETPIAPAPSTEIPKSVPPQIQKPPVEPITTGVKLLFFGVILLSLLIANFIFLGGFSLGFFITVCVGEAAIFTLLPKPEAKKTLFFSAFLGISIVGLAFAFFMYSDAILSVINFFVIVLLLLIQLLYYSEAVLSDWDKPRFFAELCISPFLRPFQFLGRISRVVKSLGRNNKEAEISPVDMHRRKVVKSVLIGILLAAPVLLIVVGLLSSADQVFGLYTQNVFDFFMKIKISEYIYTIIIAAIGFPFLFSFLYSYYTRYSDLSISKQLSAANQPSFSIEPIMAATFILCLNIVYGLFSVIQFGSLFGAFQSVLPKQITFAEYARQGFFQLSAVAFINILIVIISVLLVRRTGLSGVFVKIMSVLLVAFTFILLASAAYRMKMYIDVYSLSKLRVLVSLFMVLIGLLLIYSLIKEFLPGFKFVKFGFITAVLVLLVTNFLNVNALIAKYNTTQFVNNPKSEFNVVVSGVNKVSYSSTNYSSNGTGYETSSKASESYNSSSDVVSNVISSDVISISVVSSNSNDGYIGSSNANSGYDSDNIDNATNDNGTNPRGTREDSDGASYKSRIIDSDYLIFELSYDAIPEILVLLDAKDPEFAANISNSLINLYKNQLRDYSADNWKSYNLSKERAKSAIESRLGEKIKLIK